MAQGYGLSGNLPTVIFMVDRRKHEPCVPDISRQVTGINDCSLCT